MSIESDLYESLTGNAGLNAIISGRVYPHVPRGLPQRPSLPAVTYQRIGGVPVYTYRGRAGLTASRFQFNCFGRTNLEAIATCQALIEALDGFPGIRAMEGPRDLTDPDVAPVNPVTGEKQGIVWRSIDVQVWHVM